MHRLIRICIYVSDRRICSRASTKLRNFYCIENYALTHLVYHTSCVVGAKGEIIKGREKERKNKQKERERKIFFTHAPKRVRAKHEYAGNGHVDRVRRSRMRGRGESEWWGDVPAV